MQKNSISSEYKKNYDGDYSKSYKDYLVWKKQSVKDKAEYQVASKKLNEKPYNRSEKSNPLHQNIAARSIREEDRVDAAGGNARRGRVSRNVPIYKETKNISPTITPSKDTRTYQHPNDIAKAAKELALKNEGTSIKPASVLQKDIKETQSKSPTENRQSQQTYTSPNKKVFYEEKTKVEIPNLSQDFGPSNINGRSVDYPLLELGENKFQVVKTQKQIGAEDARKILKDSGYMPKQNMSLGPLLFVFIMANIFFSMAAPIAALGYGYFMFRKDKTIWTNAPNIKKYNYRLPATEDEKAIYKTTGIICMVVGVIAAFIHYRDLLF